MAPGLPPALFTEKTPIPVPHTTVAALAEDQSYPFIQWQEGGVDCSARWRSERGAPVPRQVVLADDSTTADTAYRQACAGTAMLWRGDFQNARQLLQALARRCDRTPARKRRKAADPALTPADSFHQYRLAQSQRARILATLLIPFDADHRIPLRRAPDARLACAETWGPVTPQSVACVASLRDLLGMTSAHEWRRKGVEIAALGIAPHNRIHPHYGVFSPVRGEYIQLVADAPLPVTAQQPFVAFDIGTGTGVLSAVLARRAVARIVATDVEPRALACAAANMAQLGTAAQVELLQTDLFPAGLASLIVCNPPWLPARPSAPIERAVYDENSQMLLGFLRGLAAHLTVQGEGWLILSDLAEHLGLRSRSMLLEAIAAAGLQILGRIDTQALHPKAQDAGDALHAARAAEVTSLWRLGLA